MSTEQQVAKVSKRKRSETSGSSSSEEKKKKTQDIEKLSACHARNALHSVKGDVHLNDDSMHLLAKGMQDYLERLVEEASLEGDKRDSHKNLIIAADIVKAAEYVPMIFPSYIFDGYVEKVRKPKQKKVKTDDAAASETSTTEQTQDVASTEVTVSA
jgi:hypothetical protein